MGMSVAIGSEADGGIAHAAIRVGPNLPTVTLFATDQRS